MGALRGLTDSSLIPFTGSEITYEMAKPALFCHNMAKIEEFEDAINENCLNEKDELNLHCMEHEIINGMVRRTLFIPKGMFVTGRIHKEPYIDMVIWGDVEVQVQTGTERYDQFTILEGIPGRKRVLYAHADTLWTTVDRTTAKSLDEVEDNITFGKFCEYNEYRMGLTAGEVK